MNYDCFYFQLVIAVFLYPQILFSGLCIMCFGMCLCKWVCRPGNDVGCLFLFAVHVTLSRWDLSLNLEVAFCPGQLTSELESTCLCHLTLIQAHGVMPSFSVYAGDFNPGPHVSTASSRTAEPLLALASIFKNLQI